MSLYNYVDTPNANLVCCICRAPFVEPTTTLTCAHTFCADCILRALTHSRTCPIDRTPLSPADLVPANPIVGSLVDELRVECVHRAEGCAFTSQRVLMPLHLRDDCIYAEVGCEEEGCGMSMRRGELRGHRKDVHGKVEEEGEENGSEKHKELEEDVKEQTEHGREETNESYTCPHAAVGCPYDGPLKPSEHLPSCPYESLKGLFTMNTAKVSLLTEQNMILRHKVDTLESTVHTLRKEMNTAKNALGPWFRSSYHVANLGAPSGMMMGASVPGMASSDLPAGMQAAVAGPSSGVFSMGEEGGDALASYFPSEEMVRPVAMGPRTASMMGGAESMYGRAGSIVAPLDLSTTLEGTLVGLRESMVGLAAGVDSAGRRNEIALTNETLRLGEEMMSVRAQMHGLRMQVHGMMMDRNAALSMRPEDTTGQYFPVLQQRPNMNFGVPPSITKL
ncbi:hypothetical protein BDZ97DRAFT_1691796 [Flammula alnicola]|nr:hypothetical protein BDZ97DRAFT_1691796 [Flammula alnicola]